MNYARILKTRGKVGPRVYKKSATLLKARPWSQEEVLILLREFRLLNFKYKEEDVEQFPDSKMLKEDMDYYMIIRIKKILFKIDSNYPISQPLVILCNYNNKKIMDGQDYMLSLHNKCRILKVKCNDTRINMFMWWDKWKRGHIIQ